MKLDSAACGLVFLSVCSKVAGAPLPVYETPVTGPIK